MEHIGLGINDEIIDDRPHARELVCYLFGSLLLLGGMYSTTKPYDA